MSILLKNSILFCLLIGVLGSCSTIQHIADVDQKTYRISEADSSGQDSSIIQIITPYKEVLDAEMNVVIGYASIRMSKKLPESTLGNFVCDLLLEETQLIFDEKIHFALQNYGGLRIPEIPKGDITLRKVYELMPFDNFVVILELDGTELKNYLDYLAGFGGCPISGSLRFEIEGGKAENISIDGKSFDANGVYRFITSDYIANGGDGTHFKNIGKRTDLNVLIRDMIVANIRKCTEEGREIKPVLDGRIRSLENNE